MYQNLSRKWRPQKFQSMVGQESIVTTLKNAILKKHIAPAYLFCGSRGTGKTTLARLFAKALNCHSLGEDQEPCNNCPSCLDIIQGRSMDILEIDGASNRGIDDIRQINETIGYATAGGHYKIYIIDEVHMLTKEAFNALLKTLEEPPENVKFLFATTEPQKVLPTILSRCQRFDLARLTTKQIGSKLKTIADDLQVAVEPDALELIAHVAEGGLRDAESLFDQLLCFEKGTITYASAAKLLGTAPKHFYFQLDKAIANSTLSAAFELSSELFSTGRELQTFLEGLLDHFRIYLQLHLKVPVERFLHPSEKEHYKQMLSIFSQDHILYMLDYLTGWVKEMNKTPFKQITLEMILLHLIRSIHRLSLPTLVRRLEELSSGEQKPAEPIVAEQKPSIPCVETKPAESMVATVIEQEMATVPPVEIKTPEKPKAALTVPEQEPSIPSVEIKPTESLVITVIEQEMAMAPSVEIKTPEKLETPPPIAEQNTSTKPRSKGHYDTILRFAAIELEGILKKD